MGSSTVYCRQPDPDHATACVGGTPKAPTSFAAVYNHKLTFKT